MRSATIPLALLLSLLVAGCLDREEVITVRPDGSLDVVHRIRGDGGDLANGAARYPGEERWAVTRSVRTKEDGKQEHTLTASASFASAKEMPQRFGPADDPWAARRLHLSTEVTVRREGGRTFYRFVRTYEPRRWASYRFFERRALPEEVQKLLDKADKPGDLPVEDRRRLLEGYVLYERLKMQHWAENALATVAPDAPRLPEVQLAARGAIARYFAEHLTFERLDGLLSAPSGEVEELAARVQREVNDLVFATAQEALGLPDEKAKRLAHELEAEHQDYEVTQDLGDENFTVRLKLPGKLLADNGDAREDGFVVWKFDGKALRDRRQQLVATSVVE